MTRIEAFYKVSVQCLKNIQYADELYKQEGNGIKDALSFFSSRLPTLIIIQKLSAEYSLSNEKAAKICIEFSKASALCLPHLVDIKTRIYWHNAAYQAARFLNIPIEIYLTGNNLAIEFTESKNEEAAIKLLNECLEILNKSEEPDLLNKARILNSLGLAYKSKGANRKAIDCFKEKLSITNDDRLILSAYANIGIAHKNLKEYDQAIEYHKRRLEIAKKLKMPLSICNAFGDIGIVFFNKKDLIQSILYFKKQLRIARRLKIDDAEGRALWGLAQAHHLNGDITEAIKLGKNALRIKEYYQDSLVPEIRGILLEWIKSLNNIKQEI